MQVRQGLVESIDLHAVLVQGHAHQLSTQTLVSPDGPPIGQLLGDDDITGLFHERFGHQGDRLHGTVRQGDVIRRDLHAFALGLPRRHYLAQPLVAQVPGIVHKVRPHLEHGLLGCFRQFDRGKRGRVRTPTTEIIGFHSSILG